MTGGTGWWWRADWQGVVPYDQADRADRFGIFIDLFQVAFKEQLVVELQAVTWDTKSFFGAGIR